MSPKSPVKNSPIAGSPSTCSLWEADMKRITFEFVPKVKNVSRAREKVQCLRALADLPEDPSLLPNSHGRCSRPPVTPTPEDTMPSFRLH